MATWLWVPAFAAVMFILLLYPTGRLVFKRWRPVAWAVVVWGSSGFQRWPWLRNSPILPGPARPGAGRAVSSGKDDRVGAVIAALVILTAVGVLMVSLVSLAVRFRHARGTVRQQLKWLVYAMSLAVVAQLVPAPVLVDPGHPLGALGLPIAIAVAILRYHLYDIDLLINRTWSGNAQRHPRLGLRSAVLILGQLFAGISAEPPSGPSPQPPDCGSPVPAGPAASSKGWTGVSIGGDTTRSRPWRHTPSACATTSTWTPLRPSCSRSSTPPWSPPGSRLAEARGF